MVRQKTTCARTLLACILLAPSPAVAQSPPSVITPSSPDTITWYAVSSWGVEGRGWSDVKRFYDRLPGRAEGVVPEKVWGLSRHSAGMSCRFITDATEIHVRYS
ncbi:MAG TPA: SGNH/GDSL hydrolase N-terminal domain-containing protein, partial [Bacteroidota bacterium]|nr:SGNH/GDSL hydrolase N-terminal domain-containing protein [Bacteroidota bacterium]